MFKTYQKKIVFVEAFQWHGGVVNGIVDYGAQGFYLQNYAGGLLTPGDYIVKFPDGKIRSFNPTEFEKEYELAPTLKTESLKTESPKTESFKPDLPKV